MRNLIAIAVVVGGFSTTAWAGRGSSDAALQNAIASSSVDAIVSELERSEHLMCMSCINTVLPLVDFDSAKVREAAGWWLGRRGARSVVIDDMTARLGEQDPVAARNAADVLAGMRDPATMAALTQYLANPLDEASGVAAARALGEIGHPKSLVALKGALASPLAGVRTQALISLRNLRAPVGQRTVTDASTLTGAFADSDAGVRVQAAYTAGHLKDRAAVAPLGQLVAGDAQPQVRKAAAWALGEIGDGAAQAALTAARNDADAGVRSIANAALGRLTK